LRRGEIACWQLRITRFLANIPDIAFDSASLLVYRQSWSPFGAARGETMRSQASTMQWECGTYVHAPVELLI
jgi:hypothetical protein